MAPAFRWFVVLIAIIQLAAEAFSPPDLEERGSADADDEDAVIAHELIKKALDELFATLEIPPEHTLAVVSYNGEDEVNGSSDQIDELPATVLVKSEDAGDIAISADQDFEANTPSVYTNLALRRPTWQSSTHNDAKSHLSVDGNKNTSYFDGSCSHTASNDRNPWWAVDLGQMVQVHSVNLTNRGDCCGYRMNNFVVGLTNNTPNLMPPTIYGYVECGRWNGAAPGGKTLFVKCTVGQVPARYVVILTHQPNMNFCELEVYGNVLPKSEISAEVLDKTTDETGTNFALGRPTWQSSTGHGGVSWRAVDGNYDTLWSGGSCSHTADSDDRPWWSVDLGQPINVRNISLVNRGDCCGERMNNFIVGLTNDPPYSKPPTTYGYTFCGQWPGVAPDGRSLSVKCEDDLPPARYVVIMTHQRQLTICELAVYGTVPTVVPPTDIPQNVHADQRSNTVICQEHSATFSNYLWPVVTVVGALLTLCIIVAAMHSYRPKRRIEAKLFQKQQPADGNVYQSLDDFCTVQNAKNGAKGSSVWSVSTYVMTDGENVDGQSQTNQEAGNICNI